MKKTLLTLALLGMLAACGGPSQSVSDFSACAQGSDLVLMPHHLLVKPIIEQVYTALAAAGADWDKIVIISPDHFSQGTSGISAPAANEHGFTIHRDLAAQYLPGIPIEGWMVRLDATPQEVTDFVNQLNADAHTLFIFSIDFSHYLPGDLAHVHDLRSIDILQSEDVDAARSVEVDSPIAVEILLRLLRARGEVLTDLHNTNPSLDTGIPTFENTTHVFACSTAGTPGPRTLHTTMVFAHPRDWYLGRTQEDRALYGTDDVLFDQGGTDHALLNTTRVDFHYFDAAP